MMASMIGDLWVEHRRRTPLLGSGESRPRLSYILLGGARQTSVEFEATDDFGRRRQAAVLGERTSLHAWPFEPLASREHVEVRVRATTEAGTTDWSAPLQVETGLLHRDDWTVDFVSPELASTGEGLRPGFLLRADFDLERLRLQTDEIRRARVYATAHGVYELEINGVRSGEELLAPGWTSYHHRLRYQTYAIEQDLRPGMNTIGIWLADGWYRGRLGFDGGLWDNYGADVALLLQLELTLTDGSVVQVPLRDAWQATSGPITGSGLYDGERFDARTEPTGWNLPGFDATGWTPVQPLPLLDYPAELEAPLGPPIRITGRLEPIAVTELDDGTVRLDFGQNIAGKLQLEVTAAAGSTIEIRHAEVLEDGHLGIRPLRTADAFDTYTCRTATAETWTPRFTIHGFRYAEIRGLPAGASSLRAEALVIHSDMERTGWFDSSHAGLNRLHQNVVWSMRDNFVDLPTDCPQRDERLGWTGDIQVFGPTALFLYGAAGVLSSWLRDVAVEQVDHGHVPNFVPWIECGFPNHPTAAWGDAAVIVPWDIYQATGDEQVLATQYDSMRAWVDLVASLCDTDGLWAEGFQLGDWLDPAAPPERPGESATDRYLVASAYHIRTARLLARTAQLLGHAADASKYAQMAERATRAFQHRYVASDGLVRNDTVTANALCLVFGLLSSSGQIAIAGARLSELVKGSGHRISTGFVGTPIVCDALVLAGDLDSAYRLMLQVKAPSWLYAVSMGATTIWERWDSMLPDGSINPGDMTSFNHYALGAVADFLHRVVAGLTPVEPGYRSIVFAPHPGGGLTRASAQHHSPLGLVASSWTQVDDRFDLEITVPEGAIGTVLLPGDVSGEKRVGPGSHHFTSTYQYGSFDAAQANEIERREHNS